ncbi:hypothetical protein [Flavobacterium sp. HNIBRBA15423]|uniref:hypothetical protein n=1 Tax=Flavobacterium sp. HNIBRBA15423 TaxID=3458683 RepID=UPI004044C732
MKNLFLNKLNLVLALVALTFASCEKESVEIDSAQDQTAQSIENFRAILLTPTSQELPEAVKEQLNSSKANLLTYTDNSIEILGVTVLGTVKTTEALNLSKELLSSKESIAALGDITEPASIVSGQLKDLYSGNELLEIQKSITEVATSELKLEDQVMEISWQINNKQYKSFCFYRANGIVWDNIIGGLVIMGKQQIEENVENDSQGRAASKWRSLTWTANWLWGSKRGTMGAKITIYYSGSTVSNTDRSDWGTITLGKAKSESKIIKNSGSYGKIQYALGLCTPVGSLSFNSSNFTVSFSGLGSNMVANGTMSLYP